MADRNLNPVKVPFPSWVTKTERIKRCEIIKSSERRNQRCLFSFPCHGTLDHSHGAPGHSHGTPDHSHGTLDHSHGTLDHSHGTPEHSHDTPDTAMVYPDHSHGTPDPSGLQNS